MMSWLLSLLAHGDNNAGRNAKLRDTNGTTHVRYVATKMSHNLKANLADNLCVRTLRTGRGHAGAVGSGYKK